MWKTIALIAVLGAVGTVLRYLMGRGITELCGDRFPWATLVVNAVGCLLFGWIWQWSEERELISETARGVLLVGLMGAFTTYSTYAFETSRLMVEAQWGWALLNVGGQTLLGIACVFGGFALGKWL